MAEQEQAHVDLWIMQCHFPEYILQHGSIAAGA